MISQTSLMSELEEALAGGSEDHRAKTLRRITDLFVFGSSNFTSDHVTLFDGVLNHIVANVEQSARQVLAQRLAGVSNAPPNVIRTLAFDEAIEVARPVLEDSAALDNATLVENSRVMSQQHLLAISRRKTLPDTVTDVLVERGDRAVALSTAANAGAALSQTGFVRLVARSKGDDDLARAVGSRPDIPRQQFLKLLNTASQAVRIVLEAAHPQGASEVRNAVADVAKEIQITVASQSRDYARAQALIDSLQQSGLLSESHIASFAAAGRFEEAVLAMAGISGLSADVIERVLMQERADTILIAVRATNLSWPTAKALLILCAGKAGVPPPTLAQYQNAFNRIKPETARQIFGFLRKT